MTQDEYNLMVACEYLENYKNLSVEERAKYKDFLDFIQQTQNTDKKTNDREE